MIKKGDLDLVKAEVDRLNAAGYSSILPHLQDDKYNHNAIFYATQIKNEGQCMRMVDYLLSEGVDATVVDTLNQTALFYAWREGRKELMDILIR